MLQNCRTGYSSTESPSYSYQITPIVSHPKVRVGEEMYLATSITSGQDIFIKNERCWATPTTDPEAEPFKDLVVNG